MANQSTQMQCPRCAGTQLTPVMTKQGVEVDRCHSCGWLSFERQPDDLVWLDRPVEHEATDTPAEMTPARVAGQRKIKFPRMGIIEDGAAV